MNSQFLLPAALLFFTLGLVSNAQSAPYQFQLSGTYSKDEAEFESAFGSNSSTDSNTTTGELTYYLRPVDAASGPLLERAFVSKSAWLKGSYGISEEDANSSDEIKSTIVNSRFVTQSDLIVELDYIKIDSFDRDASYSIGVGRYLDSNITAVLKLIDSGDDVYTILGNYRKLTELGNPGTYLAFNGGLGYVDTKFDSEIQFNFQGTYYFSDFFSVGAGLVSIGDSDTYIFNSNYFLTESFYAGLGYSKASFGDFLDSSSVNFTVGARF